MTDVFYHNPRCSKCARALDILRERKKPIRVIEYLKTPPSVDELAELCRLGAFPAKELVRDEPVRFAELGISLADERDERGWLQLLHEHPELMQRPIVRIGDRVVVARPAARVLELLQ
jgi:arsenate reductase (glutaredoxin)